MFQPLTPIVPLESRWGRVGSIQAWNPWEARRSREAAVWWVAKIASLSYGNDAAKDPEKLFKLITERGHLSCLEFVPVFPDPGEALPHSSWRNHTAVTFTESIFDLMEDSDRATAFLVEAPIFVARQWMRHRSFSYLELSRRYVKGDKVELEFYGDEDPIRRNFFTTAMIEYTRSIMAGDPPELARYCLPVATMTKFWVAGFDRDWQAFCGLRCDTHAQAEIRVFADFIKGQIG